MDIQEELEGLEVLEKADEKQESRKQDGSENERQGPSFMKSLQSTKQIPKRSQKEQNDRKESQQNCEGPHYLG
jgi:hypothetical protein